MPAFIDDGFTRTAKINEEPGLYEEVRFSYRPATQAESRVWVEKRSRFSPEEIGNLDAEFLAKHITDWNVKNQSGAKVAISKANFLRIQPNLNLRMVHIVGGLSPDDSDGETITIGEEQKNSSEG